MNIRQTLRELARWLTKNL